MHQIRLLIFCFLIVFPARSQMPFVREFWLNESNIPVKVNDLVYASDGYLWLATDNGLFRFNGRSFTRITDTLTAPVTAVGESGGVIYAGYKDGNVGSVRSNAIHLLAIAHQRPASAITSLHGQGTLLYITTEDQGLFLVINHTGLQLTAEGGLTDNFLYDLMVAPDEVMVATDRGVNHIRWDGRKPQIEIFGTSQGLPDNIVRVLEPVPGTNRCLIGTQEGGLALYDDTEETFQSLRMSHPWAWGQINDILALSPEEAWIVTEEGYLLQGRVFRDSLDVQPYSYEGLKLKRLARDRSGNIWCATNRGLLMSTALYAGSIDIPSGYSLKNLTAMVCDRQNNLWFAQDDALYRLSLFRKSEPELMVRAPASITTLYVDEGNDLWIGTFGKGLYYLDGRALLPVRNIATLTDGHILSIGGLGGRLWTSSLNGVEEALVEKPFRGTLKLLRHHNKLSGTGSDYVYQLYPDRKGRMWMATDGGGVCMYDGERYHRWDSGSGLTSQVVYTLAEDAAGDIWAGSLERGLFRYRSNRWQQYTRHDGLQDMNIYALKGTGSGEMVVVSEDGIDQWYPGSRQFRHFNRRLGLDIDSTLTIPNCIARDQAGNVYVPYEHGFIVFTSQGQPADIKPQVHINAISLFFKTLPEERKSFSHNENHLSFRYDGVSYSNPEALKFRYKLDNYDTNWIYTNDEVIPFVQLAPGQYTFRVQASLNNRFSNAAEDYYSFMVIKPFWQRTWFIIIVALALFGAGYGYIKLRERNLKNMSRLQRERMVFEYEHLKSQVNPHFLFNSLNTLVSLIEEDKNAAADYTVHLSDLYRNMLSFKDQDLIWLEEEYQIIRNYMHIQKSRFGDALRLHTEIAPHLFRTRKIVPLALQLLVENAIKHNVVSRARPLTISIIATETELIVKNPVQPKMSREKGAGLGLENIKKRYSLLTNRSTRFGTEGDHYIVTLPLL